MLNIAFRVNGGMGTVLVRANFIQYFYNRFSNICRIDIYGHNNEEVNAGIFSNNNCYDSVFTSSKWSDELEKNYNLIVILDAWPNVIKCQIPVESEYEELRKIIRSWESFKKTDDNDRYFKWIRESKPYLYEFLKIRGNTILNSLDIFDDFKIGEDYIINIAMPEANKQDEVLHRYGLKPNKFITIQRGANPKLKFSDLPKLWPKNYYIELIKLIKQKLGEFKIVQIGQVTETSSALPGVDLSLLGQTNLETLKILLKNSYLHIDSECGMVHLRKAIHGGPSVVFFGPTDPKIFGYKGNLNLRANVCLGGCAEISEHWENTCPKGDSTPACMVMLKPLDVMVAVEEFINNGFRSPDVTIFEGTRQLLSDPRINLNQEWVESWLKTRKVFDYQFVDIKLKDLIFQKFNGLETEWDLLPLEESPVYKYLSGDREPYYLDAALRKAKLKDNPHSEKRMLALMKKIEKEGFNSKDKIIVDMDNHIMDGYHRASWLLYKYGPEKEIQVVRLYGNWNSMIKRD